MSDTQIKESPEVSDVDVEFSVEDLSEILAMAHRS